MKAAPRPSRLSLAELANYTIEQPSAWRLVELHKRGCPAPHGFACSCAPAVSLRSADGRLSIPVKGGL